MTVKRRLLPMEENVLQVFENKVLIKIYRRFRSACCLHHRPDDGGIKRL
jgi:hypothetical protein